MASRRYRAKNSLNSNISQVNARISQISKRPPPRRIATNSISSVQIREATITAANLDKGSVTNEKMAADSIRTGNILDGAVTLEKIAPGVISTTLNLTDTTKTSGLLPITRGGTGGGTAGDARTALGVAATSHTHTASQITDFASAVASASPIANFDRGTISIGTTTATAVSYGTAGTTAVSDDLFISAGGVTWGFDGYCMAAPSTTIPGSIHRGFGVVQTGGSSATIYSTRSTTADTTLYWIALG